MKAEILHSEDSDQFWGQRQGKRQKSDNQLMQQIARQHVSGMKHLVTRVVCITRYILTLSDENTPPAVTIRRS